MFVVLFKFVWLHQSWFNFVYISFHTRFWVQWVQKPRFAHNIKRLRLNNLPFHQTRKIPKGSQFPTKLLTNLHTLVTPRLTAKTQTRSKRALSDPAYECQVFLKNKIYIWLYNMLLLNWKWPGFLFNVV